MRFLRFPVIYCKERATRKTLEAKLEVFRDQNSQLVIELTNMTRQITDLQEESSLQQGTIEKLSGKNLESVLKTTDDCEELEAYLKSALENVEARKQQLLKEKVDSTAEQRLCVICQEFEKSVVLLPCRHLCLCNNCAGHDQLVVCPLCRQPITNKFGVFP
jgi:hypothetical protein